MKILNINKQHFLHHKVSIMPRIQRRRSENSHGVRNTRVRSPIEDSDNSLPSPRLDLGPNFEDNNLLSSPELSIQSSIFNSPPIQEHPNYFLQHSGQWHSPNRTESSVSENVNNILMNTVTDLNNSSIIFSEISRKLSSLEQKFEKMNEILQDIYYFQFRDNFIQKNLDYVKKFFEFGSMNPDPEVILNRMEFDNIIPQRLRESFFKARNLQLISKCIVNIRSNIVRYTKDIIKDRKTIMSGIKSIKEYLRKNISQPNTFEEMFFMTLLIYHVQLNSSNVISDSERKFNEFNQLTPEEQVPEYNNLVVKVKRMHEFLL